jgi:hypothetical protein
LPGLRVEQSFIDRLPALLLPGEQIRGEVPPGGQLIG